MEGTARGADHLIDALARGGTDTIFTLSGNHVMPVFDAAFGRPTRLVHVRHESAAVHMADAWARMTGAVGVALVTGGPGHANALGALATALAGETPLVLLSGHAPIAELGRGAFQEMAQVKMARPLTKAAFLARSAQTLGEDLAYAFRTAQSGRPGPVHVSLPSNVLGERAGGCGSLPAPDAFARVPMPLADAAAREAVRLLGAAKRPLVIAPPALATPVGRARLEHLERVLGIPVVAMESPRGLADPSLGSFARCVAKADLLALLGKPLDFTLGFGDPPAVCADCRWIVIDPDPALLARAVTAKGARVTMQALADAQSTIEALTAAAERDATRVSEAWREEVGTAIFQRVDPTTTDRLTSASLVEALAGFLAAYPAALVVCDGGEIGQWAQMALRTPNRIINGVAGAIGASIPFAIGAKAARHDAPVLAVLGDGTFGFHMAEFDTAIRHNLPFVAIVGNDGRWNAEYQIQLRNYGANRAKGCELAPAQRYDLLVAALGGHGEFVTQRDELKPALERAVASGKPACVNVLIDGLPAPRIQAR